MSAATFKVSISKLAERYLGEETGRIVYHTSSVGNNRVGAVLGRGYTPFESMEDWVRRAKADGYNVSFPEIEELVDLTGPEPDVRHPSLVIPTVRRHIFAVTILPEAPACSYDTGTARWTSGETLLSLWGEYGTNGRAIGMVKRFAKKETGWPTDVDWFIHEGRLFFKR